MATQTIVLSDQRAMQLNELGSQGRFPSADEAADTLLSQALLEEELAPYSSETLAHLRKGMAEADRNEFVAE